jgi:hypothetical protein
LLVTLNQEDNANPSKSKTFHEHFGEKWLQQWRERWEKAPPWMSVLRRKEEGAICTVHITTGSSQKLVVIGTFTAGSLGPQSFFEFLAVDPAMKGRHC